MPSLYRARAPAGFDVLWIEMQHGPLGGIIVPMVHAADEGSERR